MNHPILNGTSTPSYNDLFNNQWEVYEKILNNNYMEHRQFGESLNKFLASYFQRGFSMLDLGCGDASFTSTALLNTTISEYTGIDLSKSALDIARSNMAVIDCDRNFLQGNFLELIPELVLTNEDRFDVVLMSFSLHHLGIEEKEIVIHKIWDILQPNGVFILIDIVSQDNEDREAYIKRYLEGVRNNWSELAPEEYVMVEKHISTNDFPETQKTIYKLAKKHDFTQVENLWIDSANTAQSLCLYK